MSLAVFDIIYSSMTSFFGFEWISWAFLFIVTLVVFGALLRVPFIILLAVGSLPFLLLGIYSAIQISGWVMSLILMTLGVILAISFWRLLAR